jgi:nitroreductase/NAD-dependent dihydropyrimidine dehydrogenase PreA subunit
MIMVNAEKCIGCGQCVKDCVSSVIEIVNYKANINNAGCIKCGHCIAVCPKDAVTSDEYNMEEVKNYNKEEFDLDVDSLLNFIKFRRSIRQFKDKEVEDEKLLKIIEAGRFTQTGSNMQDVSYIIVKDELQKLKELTIEALNQMGKDILENLTPQTMGYKKYAEMWQKMYKDYKENSELNDRVFFNAPAVIIVTANSNINGGLASSNMELMTNALGLGTFFSGFFVRAAESNEKIKEFLGIKGGKQIVSCMVIGYPNVKYLRTAPRKEADVCWK